MCGIPALIAALYEDLVAAFNHVLPQPDTGRTAPVSDRPRPVLLPQQPRFTVTRKRVANRSKGGGSSSMFPSPPNSPPSRKA
ncbi:hypothetical protein FALBO_16099 [Fusarium albosuccineum]|uniref:Uncharacterized protein n=1 Tax=Fusarium albosuccineum TaxID=1237068 RepID=A0A8H4KNZ1_9HYPO|nr:hypothetical protein FALBO_16099 [Fusarium albosuccineum]